MMKLFANELSDNQKNQPPTQMASCGQSYKYFTIVIYNPRVVVWGIFKSGTTLV